LDGSASSRRACDSSILEIFIRDPPAVLLEATWEPPYSNRKERKGKRNITWVAFLDKFRCHFTVWVGEF
jgi:hypothetical protein